MIALAAWALLAVAGLIVVVSYRRRDRVDEQFAEIVHVNFSDKPYDWADEDSEPGA